jgi:hypothetical protein
MVVLLFKAKELREFSKYSASEGAGLHYFLIVS